MAKSYRKTRKFEHVKYTLERSDADFGDKFQIEFSNGVKSPCYPKMKWAVAFAEWSIRTGEITE